MGKVQAAVFLTREQKQFNSRVVLNGNVTFNLSTPEAEVGKSKFEASLSTVSRPGQQGYTEKPCLDKQNKSQTNKQKHAFCCD